MKKTFPDEIIRFLEKEGVETLKIDGINVLISELKIKEPEPFSVKCYVKILEFKWSEGGECFEMSYGKGHVISIAPEEIDEMFFKRIKACKDTNFEWCGSEKIAQKLMDKMSSRDTNKGDFAIDN